VGAPDQLAVAVVAKQPAHADPVDAAQRRDIRVRPLQVLGPEAGTCRDAIVQPAQVRFAAAAGHFSGRDDEVAVAVAVPGAQREGALHVGTDEPTAEDAADRAGEVDQDRVEFFERCEHVNAVLGFVSVSERRHFAGAVDAYVGELVAAQRAEGRRVGRALLAHAE
jgi:hypothetical protein